MFIDFSALKAALSFGDVVDKLGLELKQSGNQWRGKCPACQSDNDRALVVTEGKGWFCFAQGKGGDVIALVAHIKGVKIKEAAAFLAGQPASDTAVKSTSTVAVQASTSPAASQAAPEPDNRLEKVAARLIHEHSEVQALGLSPARAEALSVGYIKNGVLAGRVLFPLYEDGELVGFLGFAKDLVPIIKFPKNLLDESQGNVVPLKKAQ